MKWSRPVAFALLSIAAGCHGAHQTAAPPSSARVESSLGEPFRVVRDEIVRDLLAEAPSYGRDALGDHAFDGKIADYSDAGLVALGDRLRSRKARLAAIDRTKLTPNDALDAALLTLLTDSELFKLTELDSAHKRPEYYREIFDVAHYVDDEDAAPAERLARIIRHEEAALVEAPHALENLRPPLSKVLARMQAQTHAGLASYLRGDVVKAMSGVGDATSRQRFLRANEALAAHADRIAARLTELAASGDDGHILGEARYRAFLRAQEGILVPLAEFKRLGEADLVKNKGAFEALSKTVTLTRPPAAELLSTAARMDEQARQFVIDHHIVTMPPGEQPVPVRESPPYLRWNGAALRGTSTHATYFIAPPDPALSPAEQRDFIMPFGVLLTNTVHEVYPGHYIQALWADHASTVVQRLSFNDTFNEGWAHYTEQMMLDEGFGAEDPQNRLGQLSEALRRNCRYLVSIGLHTEGMTVAQAEELFMVRCHQDRATARQNAERGAFDPGYFSYTLGKIEILALRDEVKRKLGGAFSLRRFHDALLAHGRAPIPLLHDIVLRESAP